MTTRLTYKKKSKEYAIDAIPDYTKENIAIDIVLLNYIVDDGATRLNINSADTIRQVKNDIITYITTNQLSKEKLGQYGGATATGIIGNIINTAFSLGAFAGEKVMQGLDILNTGFRVKDTYNSICAVGNPANRNVAAVDAIIAVLDIQRHFQQRFPFDNACVVAPFAANIVGVEAVVVFEMAKIIWADARYVYPFLREAIVHKIKRRGKKGLALAITNENYEDNKADRFYKLRQHIARRIIGPIGSAAIELAPGSVPPSLLQLQKVLRGEDPKLNRENRREKWRFKSRTNKIRKPVVQNLNNENNIVINYKPAPGVAPLAPLAPAKDPLKAIREADIFPLSNNNESNYSDSPSKKSPRISGGGIRSNNEDYDLMILNCASTIYTASKMKGWDENTANIARLTTYSYLKVCQQNALITLRINTNVPQKGGTNLQKSVIKKVLESISKGNSPDEVHRLAIDISGKHAVDQKNAGIIADSFTDTYNRLL
jgi:hypothetical protein